MNNEKLLLTYRICQSGDKLLYMAEDSGFLASIDMTSFDVDVVAKPGYSGYRSFALDEDTILMFPGNKGTVCKYDTVNDLYYYSLIPKSLHFDSEDNWSAYYIRKDDYLYFFWASPVITRYDIKNEKWDVYRDWIDELRRRGGSFEGFSLDGFFVNDTAVFHIRNSKYCVMIDTNTDKEDILSLEFDDTWNKADIQIQRMIKYKDSILVLTHSLDGVVEILEGDCSGSLTRRICSFQIDPTIKNPFGVMIRLRDFIYLLPGEGITAYKINALSGERCEVSEIEISPKERKAQSKYPFDFSYGEIIDEKWYGINFQTNKLVVIDGKSDRIESKTLFTKEKKEKIGKHLLKYGPYIEDGDFGFDGFVDHITGSI